MILVTGGAGFIGSNFVLEWFKNESLPLINFDKLTYAGNLSNLKSLQGNPNYTFIKGDILDRQLIKDTLQKYRPKYVIHFAAETHVDRSIYHPEQFVQTNILGTFTLLDECFKYWKERKLAEFRFLHVSTDEVFGSLEENAPSANEKSPYAPNSPYASSKAASDLLVRSYYKTYGFPAIITYCTNNFGPFQFPEKMIPLMILNGLKGAPLPIYGDGKQIRNWLYVEDHCDALRLILKKGRVGQTYDIGNANSLSNNDLVTTICAVLDEVQPQSDHNALVTHIVDRPGHDRRYSLDTTKIEEELHWKSKGSFEENLRKTIFWYIQNKEWVEQVISGEYQQWLDKHYGAR